MIFGRKNRGGGAATAQRDGSALTAELDSLLEENRRERDPERERRILRLRHRAGIEALGKSGESPALAEAAEAELGPRDGTDLPEFTPDQLTPGLLRAAILRDGCLLVRGAVDRDRALAFADGIDRVFAERDAFDDGTRTEQELYEEFAPDPPYGLVVRPWIKEGGGVLAGDSPPLAFEMLEMFTDAGLVDLIGGYLGEHPVISLDKATLRKAEPQVGGAWHQDGLFMGEVRAMNVWLSLSRCGDEAPGLDIVPRRLEEFVTAGNEEARVSIEVTADNVREAAGEYGVIRPIFEPGDLILFDDRFLHQTGSDPSMPNPRFAIESWFFGPSSFPGDYSPVLA